MTPLRQRLPRRGMVLIIGLTVGSLASSLATADDKPADLRELARTNNQFALELYQQLRAEKGNLFLSPYSISTALAMTTTGARGMTAEEMVRVLHLSGGAAQFAPQFQQLQDHLLDQAKGYELRIGNALWGQNAYPFKQDFVAGLQQRFRAEGRTLDFDGNPEGSRNTINRWVENATKNKIQNLIPSGVITGDTRLVLTNAIYFKGLWAEKFEKSATRSGDFFSSGESVKIDMMHRVHELLYAENDAVQMVELPYQGHRLAMVVLLPRKKDGIADVEANLTVAQLESLLRGSKSRNVDLRLPRTKTTSAFQLKSPLMAMGMRTAFTKTADFTGMEVSHKLFIDEVVHKAFCEVNEEGTEAAGATGVVMKTEAAQVPQPPVEFRADHPYLYMIRDTQTGSLLFLGRMTDPRQ